MTAPDPEGTPVAALIGASRPGSTHLQSEPRPGHPLGLERCFRWSDSRALLLLHLGQPEVPAEVGQRLQIDVAHQVGDGELPGFAGQDGDAGNLTFLVAHPHFDVLALPAALDADYAAPVGRLELIAHL